VVAVTIAVMRIALWLLLVAACGKSAETGSSVDSSETCGIKVKILADADDYGVVTLEFENVSDETVTVGSSTRAAFADSSGNAMEAVVRAGPGSEADWFGPTRLPSKTRRRLDVKLGGGDAAMLDRIEVPGSGPGRVPTCTVKASGLATSATAVDARAARTRDKTARQEASHETVEGFRKAMCECKDAACADKVNAEMARWGSEMARTADKNEKPDSTAMTRMNEVLTKYTECMTKLMMMPRVPPE
jgi:hypothetical protein